MTRLVLICAVAALMIAACTPAPPPPKSTSVMAQALTPIPTLALPATDVPTVSSVSVVHINAGPSETMPAATQITTTAAQNPLATDTPSETPTVISMVIAVPATEVSTATLPSATQAPAETPTPVATLPRIDHYVFTRPFPRSDTLVDYIDRTYPYGSSQNGSREVHLGVDYANRRNTVILAVGAGEVVFAGPDSSTRIGPAFDYYGNTVVVKHDVLSPDGLPVYTLYGHMEKITVKTGQIITAGDPIGTVGDSGIAIGPHLHLEVRVGGNGLDDHSTRNPDLWIQPYPGYGTLAGYVSNAKGLPIRGQLVLVRIGTRTRETYTYGERVNGDAVWQENFTLGDLPAGTYDVIVSDNGNVRFQANVSIRAGETAFVDIRLKD